MGSTKDRKTDPGKEVECHHSTSPSEVERQLAVKIGERITQIRGHLTQKEFARPIGLNFGSIGKYERGVQAPGAEVLNNICEVYGINHQWLLTGEGPMKKEEQPHLARPDTPEITLDLLKRKSGELIGPGSGICNRSDPCSARLPVYEISGSTGPGSFLDSEKIIGEMPFPRAWITNELKANPKDLVIVFYKGESMIPTFGTEGYAMVNLSQTDARDGIFLFRLDNVLMIKRFQRLPENKINVLSDNHNYNPFLIDLASPPSDFAIIGRIVWFSRFL